MQDRRNEKKGKLLSLKKIKSRIIVRSEIRKRNFPRHFDVKVGIQCFYYNLMVLNLNMMDTKVNFQF